MTREVREEALHEEMEEEWVEEGKMKRSGTRKRKIDRTIDNIIGASIQARKMISIKGHWNASIARLLF